MSKIVLHIFYNTNVIRKTQCRTYALMETEVDLTSSRQDLFIKTSNENLNEALEQTNLSSERQNNVKFVQNGRKECSIFQKINLELSVKRFVHNIINFIPVYRAHNMPRVYELIQVTT